MPLTSLRTICVTAFNTPILYGLAGFLLTALSPMARGSTNDLALISAQPWSNFVFRANAAVPEVTFTIRNDGPDTFGTVSANGVTNRFPAKFWLIASPDTQMEDANNTTIAESSLDLFLANGQTATYTITWPFYYFPAVALSNQFLYLRVSGSYLNPVTDPVAANNFVLVPNRISIQVPPAIEQQPESMTFLAAGNASFVVKASGSEPLTYQWRRDGQALSGNSTSSLMLSAGPTTAGAYDMIVSNAYGAATSRVARLYWVPNSPGATFIGGRITGVLPANSYTVQESLTVTSNSVLQIQPGATLSLASDLSLTVSGKLIATGTALQPITFASASPNTKWTGILLQSLLPTTNVLEHVRVSGANLALQINNSGNSVRIQSSKIENNIYGIYLRNRTGQVLINDCLIAHNSYGVTAQAVASGCSGPLTLAVLIRNEIAHNTNYGVHAIGSGDPQTGCTFPPTGYGHAILDGNFIHHNEMGIRVSGLGGFRTHGSGSIFATNNLIAYNSGSGVVFEWNAGGSLINNTIARNGKAGIEELNVVDYRTLDLFNNNITFNRHGIVADKLATNRLGTVANNNSFGNTNGNWSTNYPQPIGILSTANHLGAPADLFGNISTDPLFVAPFDFHLRSGSPMVNAGSRTNAAPSDFDGDTRDAQPDIGFDEWTTTGPNLTDSDGDTLPDLWEIANRLDPLANDADQDADADGLANLAEYQHGTNPRFADSDGDGANDGAEIFAGSDPRNAASVPAASLEIATAVELMFPTIRGAIYGVDVSDDLQNWRSLPDQVTGDGNFKSLLLSTRLTGKLFYRILLRP